MLIFEIALILLASKIAGSISVRLGQPSVLGKLLVGILLGPAILGIIHETEPLKEISEIGVILLMFIAGLETDIDQFKKTAGASTSVGILGIVFPLGLGYLAGTFIGLSGLEAVFLGLLLSATSVSISVQVLKEIGNLKSREGATILGAAVIDDVVVVILLAFVTSLAGSDASLTTIIVKKVIFFAVAILAAWKVVPWVLKRFVNFPVSETIISAALIICFTFSFFADKAGVATIIGAYIAGIAISLTPYKHTVFEKVETIGYSIFIPVFFAYIGIGVSFEGIGSLLPLILILTVIAIASKLVGGTIGARLTKFSWNDSLGIGSAMISRGEVALIIASIGVSSNLLTEEMFTVSIIVVLLTTLVTPPLMKFFFSNSNKKELASTK